MITKKAVSLMLCATLLTPINSNGVGLSDFGGGLALPEISSISAIPGLGTPSVKCKNPLDLNEFFSRISGVCSAINRKLFG